MSLQHATTVSSHPLSKEGEIFRSVIINRIPCLVHIENKLCFVTGI